MHKSQLAFSNEAMHEHAKLIPIRFYSICNVLIYSDILVWQAMFYFPRNFSLSTALAAGLGERLERNMSNCAVFATRAVWFKAHSLRHNKSPEVEPSYSKRISSTDRHTGERCPCVVACGHAKQPICQLGGMENMLVLINRSSMAI